MLCVVCAYMHVCVCERSCMLCVCVCVHVFCVCLCFMPMLMICVCLVHSWFKFSNLIGQKQVAYFAH